MRKNLLVAILGIFLFAGSAVAAEGTMIGAVNFATCITESKFGKKEQENLENLRGQLSTLIENTEKEWKEISAKFDDTEYLDSLSPKAEEELKAKYQSLQEDLARYQNQFYQVLNHANYQMIQKVSVSIATASEKVARHRKLDYVMNKEACFYIRPDLDVTALVVSEMDRLFDLEAKAKNLSENGETPADALQDKNVSESTEPANALPEILLQKAG